MFRTSTGQTGIDAYVFEAAAIANAQRQLDARFQQLRETVLAEQPKLIKHSTDFMFSGASAADYFCKYINGRA